ncbi:unnamed protein product, partial [Closterium sp. NIES-53]
MSGTAPAPPATADSATRSQWLTRDAAARLAIRNHLPLAECAHFGQHRTTQALYDAVVARYSSPATTALGRLLLPYLFPKLSAFATVEDLVSHLRTSDARYRAALPAKFLAKNLPPMYITLYFIVTRLPDSLRAALLVALLAHPSLRGVPPPPLPPPMPLLLLLASLVLRMSELLPLVGSRAAARARVPGVVEVAAGVVVGAAVEVVVAVEVVAKVGVVAGVGALVAEVEAAVGVAVVAALGVVEVGLELSVEVLEEAKGSNSSVGARPRCPSSFVSGLLNVGRLGVVLAAQFGDEAECPRWADLLRSGVAIFDLDYDAILAAMYALSVSAEGDYYLCVPPEERGASWGSGSCPYVIRTGERAGQTCGKPHTQHRCFFRLDNAWHVEFGDVVERPRWEELLRSQVAIFDLEFDAILGAMYALSVSAEGDCYLCVPPDPGIEAAALGASESALPGTMPAEAMHTFTLDSGDSHCFFRDSTTLTPLSAPVPVRLADPSGGPVLAHSSTMLPSPAVLSGSLSGLHLPSFSTNLVSTAALQDTIVTTTTPGGQRVSICTCTQTGHRLATFIRWPGSSLYTMATKPPQVAASAQVSASGQVAPPCSCRLLSHQTLLWHHRLGHLSLQCLHGMHSCLLVSGLPRSLPPLPPSPAPPCLPCVEGQKRAAPHSSFPPMTAPLQTLHMDVWSQAHVSGQGRERYFLLVVDDYTRYTTVFLLHSKGQVVDVLIPWIRTVRLQLCEWFHQDLPVLRLHSDKGVMEVARTSMIHAAAPHFQWLFAVRYAAHQLNLWPCVSMPKTSPRLRWTGKVGDVLVFRVWGSRAFVRDTSADKLSTRAILCVFLGFSPDAPGWQFYHPTLRSVFPSQDVTFDESVPFYHLFPYRSAPSPTPAALPCSTSPSGRPPPPPGSCSLRGAACGGVAPGGAESEGAESRGAEPRGAEPGGAETE